MQIGPPQPTSFDYKQVLMLDEALNDIVNAWLRQRFRYLLVLRDTCKNRSTTHFFQYSVMLKYGQYYLKR